MAKEPLPTRMAHDMTAEEILIQMPTTDQVIWIDEQRRYVLLVPVWTRSPNLILKPETVDAMIAARQLRRVSKTRIRRGKIV